MKKLNRNLPISSFNYDLPSARIAEFPLEKRDDSRLLIYKGGTIKEDLFFNLPGHIPSDSLIILNQTRVIEARIVFQKPSGAFIEIFCLEPYLQSMEQAMQQKEKTIWKCLIGGASKWKPHQLLIKNLEAGQSLQARFISKQEDCFLIEFEWQPAELSFAAVLHESGAIPLPPYIKRKAGSLDAERYQTIFAADKGSVAAPTASLHFTKEVFADLKEKNINCQYVTLHVGAGTFKPVKTATIAEHHMHGEPFSIEKKTIEALLHSNKIIAAGTTSLRTIESLYWFGMKIEYQKELTELEQWECYELADGYEMISKEKSFQNILKWMEDQQTDMFYARTSLVIIPGYEFQLAAGLITNFHQPQSTLLLLVAAFIGDNWKTVYEHAMNNDFRFLSYGDSSLLWRI
jgi:S-adenosylmethionine:tRNA ribosyltransferase-isomerase